MTRPVPKIGIAAESMGDARFVMVLVDRLLIEEIEWIRETFDACRGSLEDGLSTCRSFGGVEGGAFLDLHDAYDLARDRGLRVYGHFNGEPGAADAHMHRAALFLDPCATPENLTSKNESDPKDAKRILRVLTKTGRNAVERWEEVPFEQLESNGSACGLRDFICEGRKKLVPVVDRG